MLNFKIPTHQEVSAKSQAIFYDLKKSLGFSPNLHTVMEHSASGLADYLTFLGAATSFSKKEKEVIVLAIEVNDCRYCQAAHTSMAKMNGFDEEQIFELRKGRASWSSKLDALAKIAKAITEAGENIPEDIKENFYKVGYTEENLMDLIIAGRIVNITNNMHH